MKDGARKLTGVFRAGVITILCFFFLSFLFKGLGFVATVLAMKLGASAVYIGVAINILGAAFAAWAGTRIAMIGREMKPGRSTAAALFVATIPSAIDLLTGLMSGALASMSGRGGSYLSTIIQSVSFFIVIFIVSKAVFGRREMKPVVPPEDNLASSRGNG
jgi:uncharacterized membrane protein